MKYNHKILASIALCMAALLASCGGAGNNQSKHSSSAEHPAGEQAESKILSDISPKQGTPTTQGAKIVIGYQLLPDVVADSVILWIQGKRIGPIDTTGYTYTLPSHHPTGQIPFRINAYSAEKSDNRSGVFVVLAQKAPTLYGHRILKTFPHDRTAYTQGLLFHKGRLLESTGLEGQSSLREIELETGKVLRNYNLPRDYFGEGLALVQGKLYQLTWQNNKAFVYDLETFALKEEFRYAGEGWGLTTDGTWLYMSDGTEKIKVIDPKNFTIVGTIEVYTNNSKVLYLNELEWIHGEIWANIYTTDTILKINPKTGVVTGVIDMSGLLLPQDITPQTDVLNGIAYDPQTKRIFVTGKNWNKLFEVSIFEKPNK